MEQKKKKRQPESERFGNWTVPNIGEHSVVCIATGPSLSQEQLNLVEVSDIHSIAVNDAYQAASWAEWHYACDYKWWKWHVDNIYFKAYEGLRIANTSDTRTPKLVPDVKIITGRENKGMSFDPSMIHYGRNSGYQAVNLAALTGAKHIILIGYDHNVKDGMTHYFGDHPDTVLSSYKRWNQECWPLAAEQLAEKNIDVVNCTPQSGLTAFRTGDLYQELKRGQACDLTSTVDMEQFGKTHGSLLSPKVLDTIDRDTVTSVVETDIRTLVM